MTPAALAASPEMSGLWTFLRVLKNEYGFIDVFSFDIGAEPLDAAMAGRITAALSDASPEREFVFDSNTGAFARLRAVQGPSASDHARTADFAAASIRQLAS